MFTLTSVQKRCKRLLIRCRILLPHKGGHVTTRRFDQLVALAAQLYPDLWQRNPIQAFDRIKDDLRRLREHEQEHEQTEAEMAQVQETWEKAKEKAEASRTHPNVPFEKGVKEITNEADIGRAMKKFRALVGKLTESEQERDREINQYRQTGFEAKHLTQLCDEFPHRYNQYKSTQARKSVAARKPKAKRE
jgi:hypothetical protein